MKDAVEAADTLSGEVDAVDRARTDLPTGRGKLGRINLKPVNTAIANAAAGIDGVAAVFGSIHGTAAAAAGRVEAMEAQNQLIAEEICKLAGDGSLDPAKAESLRDSLVATNCDGSAKPPAQTMAGMLNEQTISWGPSLP